MRRASDVEGQPEEPGLRAVRPPPATRLERRVAITSILDARHGAKQPVRIGRLEVRRKLGEGAMGIVYEAHDPELDRVVAVKVLRTDAGQQERERVTAEARALARLSHPHVVTVYDIATSDGDLFLSMEYVPGGTLQSWRAKHPEAPWQEVVRLYVQAARGLEAAHAAGVVHQDFKPENVLVGEGERVRVADFGLAHVEVERDEQGKRSVRFVGGTPRYMAPELRLGQPASPRSDQFSFCVALREALELGGGHAPARMSAILARGLDRDPELRWPSMGALADALERTCARRPEDRHRGLILERVERLWVQGVLSDSLGGRPAIPLGIEHASEHVTPPWADFGAEPLAGRRVETVADLPGLLDDVQQSLLILGAAGGGKTTAMVGLADALLRTAEHDPGEPAPVVLNLASFDPKRCALVDWVVGELVTKYSLPSRWGVTWLEQDALVLLLDGLDEVPNNRRGDVVEAIDAFRRDHPVPTVVACREDSYREIGAKLRFGGAVRVKPLDDAQLSAFLRASSADALADALERDGELREQLRNPLMLSVLVASGAHLDAGHGDRVWSELYEQYVEHALSHRGSGSYPAERIVPGLAWLARAMQRHGTTDFWLERLQASWLEGRWAVRATQVAGLLAVTGSVFSGALVMQLWAGLPLGPSLILAVIAIVLALALVRSTRVRPVEALRPSWRRSLRWMPVTMGLACAGAVIMSLRGVLFGVHDVAPDAQRALLIVNVVTSLLLGFAMGAVLGLEPADREGRVRPNQGIAQSIRTALLVGVPSALAIALALRFIAVPLVVEPLTGAPPSWSVSAASVRIGGMVGLVLFFVYGGAAFVLHWVVRGSIALSSPLPVRLVQFLDEATDRGLLRRVGGGYIFLHRTLQEYFAGLGSSESGSAGSSSGSTRPARTS